MQRRIYTPLNIKAALAYVEARDVALQTGLKLVDEDMMELLLKIDPAAEESFSDCADCLNIASQKSV
jgi:hypothetical protein